MSTQQSQENAERESFRKKLQRWADDPLSQVVAATGATIGSFALVLGGIGAIHLGMQ